MNKKMYKHVLCIVSVLLLSCTNDIDHDCDISREKLSNDVILINTVSVNDSVTNNVVSLDSFEEFYRFLVEMKLQTVSEIINIDFTGNTDSLLQRQSVMQISKQGYSNWGEYADVRDLEIRITDYQTADKLGITAFKKYYVSICQVVYHLPLDRNMRPSVATSPNCGLLLDNPRTDDFSKASRGYEGIYDYNSSKFSMYTDVVYFVEYGNGPKIWYPCSPENVYWVVNILNL